MKKMLPIIIILLIIAGIGGYFLVQRDNQFDDQVFDQQDIDWSDEEEMQFEEESDELYTGMLKDMVELGIPLRCDLQAGDYSGTTWIRGERFYSEVEVQGQVNKVIFKDNCFWTWSNAEEQGMTMCLDPQQAEEIISGEGVVSDTEAIAADAEYNCRPAAITDNRFDPPNDVEFVDLDEMMQGMPEFDM